MKGITVTLLERTQDATDAFGIPTWTETPVDVENVLVAPSTEAGEEMTEIVDPEGRRAVYTLGIPKGDTHNWEGCHVRFFGEIWRVIGKPTEGIEHLIPLQWNKKVKVSSIVTEDEGSS